MSAGESYVRSQVGDTWDAIVIGSGIGGLTTAGFLARDGHRVLMLEKHTTAGGCTQVFRRAGYEWDAGLHYMGEVHRSDSRLRHIFDHITNGQLEWAPMPEIYNRIFVGDREYEIPAGASKFAESLKGYFPQESQAIDAYLDLVFETSRDAKTFFAHRALPPAMAEAAYEQMCEPFLARADRTVTDVLSELTENEELIAVLCGHFGDYSLEPWRASFGMHAMLVRQFCPQLAGKIDHVELATPLSFNHFLGRTTGDFMSLAHTPERFRQQWISAHTPVPGLYLSGQDVACAGVSGAMVGGATAAAAVLRRNVFEDLVTSR